MSREGLFAHLDEQEKKDCKKDAINERPYACFQLQRKPLMLEVTNDDTRCPNMDTINLKDLQTLILKDLQDPPAFLDRQSLANVRANYIQDQALICSMDPTEAYMREGFPETVTVLTIRRLGQQNH